MGPAAGGLAVVDTGSRSCHGIPMRCRKCQASCAGDFPSVQGGVPAGSSGVDA
jgi:hypothetical protein